MMHGTRAPMEGVPP